MSISVLLEWIVQNWKLILLAGAAGVGFLILALAFWMSARAAPSKPKTTPSRVIPVAAPDITPEPSPPPLAPTLRRRWSDPDIDHRPAALEPPRYADLDDCGQGPRGGEYPPSPRGHGEVVDGLPDEIEWERRAYATIAMLRSASARYEVPQSASPNSEPVDAVVFCPPRVAKGSAFLLQVFLYQPGAEENVAERATEADAAAKRRGSISLLLDLPHNIRVDVHVEMPGCVITEPDDTFVWRSRPVVAQFEVYVPRDATAGEVIGRVRFAVAGLPVGTLRFKIALAAPTAAIAEPAPREVDGVRYRTAFASYSSEDRTEVLKRVQGARIAGLTVFLDALNLEPGQRWESQLYRRIKDCDVFLLFWSRSAAVSKWVAKEIAYALECQAGFDDHPPAIQPVPLERPPPPPPEVLRHLHFNDALLAHIQAAASHGSDSRPGAAG
jgi:TIR domain